LRKTRRAAINMKIGKYWIENGILTVAGEK
jgi:hypothetical protein